MKNINKARQYKRIIFEKTGLTLSHNLSSEEKKQYKGLYRLPEDCSDEELDNKMLDTYCIININSVIARQLDKMNLLNTGVCPQCGEEPIKGVYSWKWRTGLAEVFMCRECIADIKRNIFLANNSGIYSEKDFDILFMMLHDLHRNKKPNFFSHSQYKCLYNHEYKYEILSMYHVFLFDAKYLDEKSKHCRAVEIADAFYKYQIPENILKKSNSLVRDLNYDDF